MAISPTMKDQWSGKILSSAERSHLDEPSRSSAQSSAPCSTRARLRAAARSFIVLMTVPTLPSGALWTAARGCRPPACSKSRDRRARRSRSGDQVAVGLHEQGQLGKGRRGRAENGFAVLKDVEGRLVAGADQLHGQDVEQAHGTAGMSAESWRRRRSPFAPEDDLEIAWCNRARAGLDLAVRRY